MLRGHRDRPRVAAFEKRLDASKLVEQVEELDEGLGELEEDESSTLDDRPKQPAAGRRGSWRRTR
jgi:hypothetical protein